jgi:hypothetical protein
MNANYEIINENDLFPNFNDIHSINEYIQNVSIYVH